MLKDNTAAAYKRMAEEADYHPAAPSDGYGNIVGPIDVERQAREYAETFLREEDTNRYMIGCPDARDRAAFVFTIEAARAMCGMQPDLAATLLRMAVAEMEAR